MKSHPKTIRLPDVLITTQGCFVKKPIELWVEALRGGKYEQGRMALCLRGRYCSLGVACEVYQEHVGDLAVDEFTSGTKSYGGEYSHPPREVMAWLGLPVRPFSDVRLKDGRNLASLNDQGVSFADIADLIERGELVTE